MGLEERRWPSAWVERLEQAKQMAWLAAAAILDGNSGAVVQIREVVAVVDELDQKEAEVKVRHLDRIAARKPVSMAIQQEHSEAAVTWPSSSLAKS